MGFTPPYARMREIVINAGEHRGLANKVDLKRLRSALVALPETKHTEMPPEMMLHKLTREDLMIKAKEKGLKLPENTSKADLIDAIVKSR